MKTDNFYQTIIDQAPVAISILRGEDFTIQIANKSNLALWEKDLSEVFDKPLFSILHATNAQEVETMLQNVYNNGITETIKQIPVQIEGNNNLDTRWLDMTCEAIRDELGEVRHIMVISKDATAEVVSRIKANESQKALEQLPNTLPNLDWTAENKLAFFDHSVQPAKPLYSILAAQDITSRQKMEESLRKMLMHLKLATESANVGTWSLDEKLQELEWSPLHKKMWGYDEKHDDLVYEDWHSIIHPDDKERCFKAVETAKVAHTQYEVEYRIIRANDGVIRWIKSIGNYHYTEAGEAITLTGISIDISKRKQSDEALRKTQERLHTGLKVANIALAEINYTTDSVQLSTEAAEMYGLPLSNLNVSRQELHDTFHPDYKQELENQINKYLNPDNGSSMEVEHPIVLPTGEVRWLKVNKQFFFDPSVKPEKPLYSVLAAQDITSRKEAEEKIKKARELFEITLQNVPSAIYHFDSTGKILYLNQIAAYQMGYDSVDEVLAEKDIYAFRKKLKENFELLNENGNPSDPEKSCSSIALKTSQPAQEVVQFVNKKNGDFFWLLTKSMPLTNEKGELTNVFTCCTDITKQKISEAQIKEARELLEITFRNIPTSIYHFDKDGNILYLNEIAARQMGYESVKEVLEEKNLYQYRKKLDETFEVRDENGLHFNVERSSTAITLKTGKPAENTVQFINKKNGHFFWLLTKAVPLADEKGNLTNVFATGTDITMQKVSEFALRQSEEKYRTLFETMDQGFCVIDLIFDANNKVVDYRFLECNPMFTQQSGLVDAVGKRILEFAPNLEQHWFTLYKNIALTGEPTRYIQKAEELGRWFEVYAFRVGDENSTKVAILFTDITERKKAEQALELSEQRFRTAFENAAIGMVFTDKEGHFLYANKAYENIVGYSLVELQQHTFMDITHPDDIQTDINDNARILQGQIRGRVAEKRYIRKDGKIVWVQLSVSLTKDNQGNAQHIIGLVEDITDKKLAVEKLKQSEETFRTLSNTLPQLVWMTTANGHEEFASKQWEEYTGVATTDENRFWNLLLHPDDRNIVQAAWGKSLSDGSSYKVTCRLKHYTGEYRWNSCEGVAIKDSEGNILKWVGAYSDIHEEKLKEQKKDEFISIASHEMKTPLTSAKAYLQLLEMTLNENDTPSVYVKKASAAVERLHSLITELLDASKIQNGQLNYTITKFDFNEMIDNTIESIQHSTAHALIKTGTIESVFSGDRDRLQQVVINLLTNAIKYSPNAKEVTIQVEQQDNMLKVSVTDKGIGMNKKHLEKIFERYYRVEEHAVHFQGLGIGLYISYNIIQRHQGKMWVESEPDKGSTFYFTLPFVNDFK